MNTPVARVASRCSERAPEGSKEKIKATFVHGGQVHMTQGVNPPGGTLDQNNSVSYVVSSSGRDVIRRLQRQRHLELILFFPAPLVIEAASRRRGP